MATTKKSTTKETETKTSYWGVIKEGETLFKGTHEECWDHLVSEFAASTVQEINNAGVRIGRIA